MAKNFTNVVKPTHICNLACGYCYNEDTRAPIMSLSTLEAVVRETFLHCAAADSKPHIDFIWHGGEPAVAGIDFYRQVNSLQRQYSEGLSFDNSFQTNGTLIDDEWAAFFHENRYRVSVSLDGPLELNDRTRKHATGKSSYAKVMRGIDALRHRQVPVGICVVISRSNKDHVEDIYRFLVREKLPFNVIPLTRSGAAVTSFQDLGLAADEYAEPWKKLYDLWFGAPADEYAYCSDFVFKTRAILEGQPQDCIGMENCSTMHVSTDPDGNVYPCATLSSDAAWCYGNVTEQSLAQMLQASVAVRARQRQVDPHCRECKWMHVCHGGCMQRAVKFFGTHDTRDYYCDSLYGIYEHIERRLRRHGNLDLSRLPAGSDVDARRAPPVRQLSAGRFKGIPIQFAQPGD